MQPLSTGNVITDFSDESVVVIGKVEIDSDGLGSTGSYQVLPNVVDFAIDTNIEDEVSRFPAYSFSITCLNTDKRYFSWNTASEQHGWLKQGRRIRIWAGIEIDPDDFYYQWITGRVDSYELSTVAGEEICTIEGRDFMRAILDYKLDSPNTYWGAIEKFGTSSGVATYSSTGTGWDSCKGIYIAYLDGIPPYDGSHLFEIYEGEDFGYAEADNNFTFFPYLIPDYTSTGENLWVYYYQAQSIESVVGDILYYAGIFTTTGASGDWVADTDYVTPTGKEVDRVWFNTGTSAFEAIRLLAEVAQYRFYFDYKGKPVFKSKATIDTEDVVDTFTDECITGRGVEENIEEVYNHIIVVGESRETLG